MNIFLDVFRLNEYNHNSLWIFFQKIYIQFIAFNFSRSKYSLIIRFQKDARNFVSLIFFNLFPFRRSPFLPAEFLLFSTGKFKSKLSSRKGTKYRRKIFLTTASILLERISNPFPSLHFFSPASEIYFLLAIVS